MKILALDLGKFNTMCCFFDAKTRKVEFLTAATDRRYLTVVFKKHKIDLVVMEACGPSGWINDLAHSLGLKTLVCSTNEDAWKWCNVKRKTDKDDALKLARMAAMNELKAVHMPSEAHREHGLEYSRYAVEPATKLCPVASIMGHDGTCQASLLIAVIIKAIDQKERCITQQAFLLSMAA